MAVWIAGLICAAITLAMALLQLSLTLGAPFGDYVLGGTHRVLPYKKRFLSGFFAVLWLFIGLIYLQADSIINMGFGHLFVKVVMIIYTLFLAYAIVGNGFITKNKKEKYVMTPLSILMFICSAFFLLQNRS